MFVLFRGGSGAERAQVAAAAGLRVLFARVEPVLAWCEFADHRLWKAATIVPVVRCDGGSASRSVIEKMESLIDRAAMRRRVEPSGQIFPLGEHAFGDCFVEVVEAKLEDRAAGRDHDAELE